MSATTQLALPSGTASPVALWHLLSLDAPTVAVLWTWFIARASHVRLPLATPVSMALAVWIIYAVDRLLDAARSANGHELQARHHFHQRHRRAFLIGITLAAIALALFLPHLSPAAIRLQLLEGGCLVAWFLTVHTTRSARRLPKEIAVGLFFTAAVFIPTVSRKPVLLLPLLPSAFLFATLCILNCLFIYAWEHRPSARQPHVTTREAMTRLPALTASLILVATAFTLLHPNPLPIACALAATLLLLLNRNRRHLDQTHLRAAADLALLTPVLFLPFLR